MSLGKIGKKLRREAKANPKKAAFLGVAALVALYFWIPLVWGWVDKGNANMATVPPTQTATPATIRAAMPVAAAATEAEAQKKNTPERLSWLQIAQWRQNDPQTMTAPPLTSNRDPFESAVTETIETKEKDFEEPALKPPALTPSAAGLVLTSTIIGPQRRVAQINGKTYAAGQTIEVDKDGLGIAFQLVEVQPRRIVLEADGQRFDLTIPEPGKSGKIELLGTAGK